MVLYDVNIIFVALLPQKLWVKKKKFVRNQPTKCSLPPDGLKIVRNLQTMGYGVVTLIYVNKDPKQ